MSDTQTQVSQQEVVQQEPEAVQHEQEDSKPKNITENGEHLLQSMWTFWYEKKPKKVGTENYSFLDTLHKLSSFNTVEAFWGLYTHVARPSTLPKNFSYHLFTKDTPPMWESYPNGGSWIIKIKKKCSILDRLWEQLVFACIGGELSPSQEWCVGVSISIRQKDDAIAVWCANDAHRFYLGNKIRELFHLGSNVLIEYNQNSKSMKEGSSYKHTKTYVINSDSDSQAQPEVEKKEKKERKEKSPHKKKNSSNSNANTSGNTNSGNSKGKPSKPVIEYRLVTPTEQQPKKKKTKTPKQPKESSSEAATTTAPVSTATTEEKQ